MTRIRLERLRLCIFLAVFVGGCAGESPSVESGAQCWDGKDNDGDQLIDCKDSDCGYLEICGQQPDQGVELDKSPLPDEGADLAPEPDQAPPDVTPDKGAPDTSPTSMYGRRCQYTSSSANLCPDGETTCVPTQPPSTDGFCTYKCTSTSQPDGCPAAPSGQRAACVYEFNHQPYCLFVCEFKGQTYDCPSELTCEPFYLGQSHCY